jgi:DNA-binding response OmpR family regulator
VLVVEDDAVTMDCWREILSRAGHAIEHAANGLGALSVLAIFRPDLVLLDLAMPGMSGPDFLRAFRACRGMASVPVLVVTALPRVTPDPSWGPCAVIRKPAAPEEVLAAVRAAAPTPTPVTGAS